MGAGAGPSSRIGGRRFGWPLVLQELLFNLLNFAIDGGKAGDADPEVFKPHFLSFEFLQTRSEFGNFRGITRAGRRYHRFKFG